MQDAHTTPPTPWHYGLDILGAALFLGLWGDLMLRASPWGLNVGLWISLGLGAGLLLGRWRGLSLTRERWWLLWGAWGFALAFAWRDATMLRIINGLALLIALTLAALHTQSGALRRMGLSTYLLGMLHGLGQMGVGSVPLLGRDIRWQAFPQSPWVGSVQALGRGLALGVPLVLLFGGLFVAADAVFEHLTLRLVHWALADMFSHAALTLLVAWGAAGLLRHAFPTQPWAGVTTPRPVGLRLGLVEVSVVLGLLNVLFLVFVVVQARYFFGGASTVLLSDGLTYAEYARRGFFELVTVTALVLPVLLLAHWLLQPERPTQVRVFQGLAGLLVVLLAIIMASALQRMWLYQATYGLTALRFYVTAFMLWLAVVFAWFGVTVLRGQRERFAYGMMVTGCGAVLVLNALNPDAIIARTNLRRAAAGAPLDQAYLTALGADAVPTLLAALPHLPHEARQQISNRLRSRWATATPDDWRAWNAARARARRAVEAAYGPTHVPQAEPTPLASDSVRSTPDW